MQYFTQCLQVNQKQLCVVIEQYTGMHTAFPLHKVASTTSQKMEPDPSAFLQDGLQRDRPPSLEKLRTLALSLTPAPSFWKQALFIHPWLLMKKKICRKQIFFLLWWDRMSRWLFTGTHVVNGGIKRFITNDIDCLSGAQLCSCHKRTQVQLHYNAFSVNEGKMLRLTNTLINS